MKNATSYPVLLIFPPSVFINFLRNIRFLFLYLVSYLISFPVLDLQKGEKMGGIIGALIFTSLLHFFLSFTASKPPLRPSIYALAQKNKGMPA